MQIFPRIDGNTFEQDGIMQVGSCAAACTPHITDPVAPSDCRTETDTRFGKMTIECGDSVSVIDPDHLPHILLVGHFRNETVGRSLDYPSISGSDIDPFVKFTLISEREIGRASCRERV